MILGFSIAYDWLYNDWTEEERVQIENWLLYMSSTDLSGIGDTIPIKDPGNIIITNVVDGEDVSMTADAAAGKVFYNNKDVDYAADKITIQDPELVGEASVIVNYYIVYTDQDNKEVRGFGQIAYNMTGAMFKKTLNGTWCKYLDFDNDIVINDSNADYQSPKENDITYGAYLSHAQYTLVRTTNEGSDEARYAIDIEYGELQYSFHHSRWNVSTLEYDENE